MINHVDHIAIAVYDIQTALTHFAKILQNSKDELKIEEIPEEKVRIVKLSVGNSTLELLEPTSSDSPIAKFLNKRGEGLHHIAFATNNLSNEIERLQGHHIKTLGGLKNGAENRRICFLDFKDTNRVLIELVENRSQYAE